MKINIAKFIITINLLFINIIGFSQILDYPQKIDSNNQIIVHTAYTLSYNETYEQANWVKYMICKKDLDSSTITRNNYFKIDTLVSTGSATLSDYAGSGYDRGHLCPAASFVENQLEMDESFYMSNVSPQHPSFNRGIWKRLENYERELAIEKDTVYIITGGILKGNLKTIGENKVAVPEYYFKIIYNDTFVMCFLIKNEKSIKSIFDFVQPLTVIEQSSGLKFKLN